MLEDLFDIQAGAILPFLLIVIIVLLFAYLGSRYKVAKANEALIVSGRRERTAAGEQRLKVVRAGGTIVLPLVHRVGTLKLTARQINVNLTDAVTRQGIKVAVQGVATFKIGADNDSIRNAAERFLEARDEEVDSIVKNVLEGSLRSIVGTLTVEELNLDRMKFQQAVQDAAKGDLATSGLQIDSFTIQAIRDESGYMELIGQQETARRERDARMAKASADQEAAVREAEAEQIKINAQRDVDLRRAETETQTAAAEARAAQSGPLAQAEATQEVVRKQTELAELEAARKQKELLTSTVRPAEADAEAQIRRAEGEKQARIAQAQAEAERVKLAGQAEASVTVAKGEAQARVTEVNAEAIAKQTTLEGNAEAGVVFTKGESEAKALALRAEAYRQFNEAAIIQTVLSMLPDIVRAAAEPMANIDTLTVVSTDGASDVVKNVTRTVTEASATVKGLTGIDVPELLNEALGGSGRPGTTPAPEPMPRPVSRAAGRGRGTRGGGSPAPAGGGGSAPPAGGAAQEPTSGASASPSGGTWPNPSLSHSVPSGQGSPGPAWGAPPPSSSPSEATPRFETPAAVDAALADADAAIRRAGQTADRALTDTAAGPARPASAEITRDMALDEAASRLANDLRGVPGVERFALLRLEELERTGPRPMRAMWRIARDRLAERYGQLTIGEFIDRARGGPTAG